MAHFRFLLNISLRTKVLVPVIACMVALIAVTVFVVNQRVTQQFEQQAAETLTTANAEFLNLQDTRSQDLLQRFHNLPNEPRYRAAFQLADPDTLRQPLTDLLAEQDADIGFYTTASKQILATIQPHKAIVAWVFQAAAAPATKQALAGKAAVDTVVAYGNLYHVVSIPVIVSGQPIGALTLGLKIGDAEAQQFSQLTHSQIALLADGRVVASTLSGTDADAQIGKIYTTLQNDNNPSASPQLKHVMWGEEHYFGMAGTFKSLTGDKPPGYLLLSSYEKPLHAFRRTKLVLLIASVCALLINSAIVWWVIRKATQPLLDLREGVEAVGRGDLSRRVSIKYQDECGQLAEVYNHMADNLRQSSDQLEKAHAELVETSRLAGMAEIASGVMHNVNNVLTSINIASTLVTESIKHSKAANLGKIVSMLREHEADLGQFLTQDPKGRQAYGYLGALSEHLVKEQESLLRELSQIQEGTKHIEEIVHAQQNFAKLSGHVETLKVSDVIGDALKMSVTGKNSLQIVKEIPDDMAVTIEKHKVLQILVNLMRNAKQACEAGPNDVKTMTIRATNGGNLVHLAVSDNGVGIDPANLNRIFSHGFTTKKDGHGFGLHSSAAAAKQLGGTLRVNSDGLGKGATFTLDLPIKPAPAQQN